ncbi:hypothetical protein jhhlp_008730 [Lomentospora prolificans]|uniref:Fungal lipase-like domain-containing protein n=1 Tax=Lomentospora prolificans TaxID=41688 RepID=A0A2N3MYV0_9PEZI|nr:hypothetical protein jhhlp_008730 [Lomentospora prolificans]
MVSLKQLGLFVALASATPIDLRALERRDPLSSSTKVSETNTRLAVDVSATDLANFKFWVQYSSAAYCNTNNAAGSLVTCGANSCPDVQSNKATIVRTIAGASSGLSAFVAVDPVQKAVVLSVRGSSNILNWITNLNFGFTACPSGFPSGCTAHAGFKGAWDEISSAVVSAVNSGLSSNPSYKVVVTGHSLGGAVGTIAGAHLRNALSKPVDIYTYGSPRVGNAVFASYVSGQSGSHYRVTHGSDPVPRLPPAEFGFYHTTPEYWIAAGAADDGVWAANEISVCVGTDNRSCNGGTSGLNVNAHTNYFQSVGGCSVTTSSVDVNVVSDEALAEGFRIVALLDPEYDGTIDEIQD